MHKWACLLSLEFYTNIAQLLSGRRFTSIFTLDDTDPMRRGMKTFTLDRETEIHKASNDRNGTIILKFGVSRKLLTRILVVYHALDVYWNNVNVMLFTVWLEEI